MNSRSSANDDACKLRKFPFPYKAMLSICSDLDETPDKKTYFEICKFLNTESETIMGKGVGLEVGNTIYFEMPAEQFSYWNTDEEGRENIRRLIKSGHIDCLHSYGDYVDSREKILSIQNELTSKGCALSVWVDHAVAPSNFGSDIMMGYGDLRDSNVYHADLTLGNGIKYVWLGRVTSIIGQDTRRSFKGILNADHLIESMVTLMKEFAKIVLGKMGLKKYAMHRDNKLCQIRHLRDGSKVTEFIRSNPFWGGVDKSETSVGLPDVLTERYLNKLVENNGYSILYTHLGKIVDEREPFGEKTRLALRKLSEYQNTKTILITTTRRLLDYHAMLDDIKLNSKLVNGKLSISLSGDYSINEIMGLTVYLPEGVLNCEMKLNGETVEDVRLNEIDETGNRSISVVWHRLSYPL